MKMPRLLLILLIVASFYSCEEKNKEGTNSLINILEEPAGENCASGGSRILTGIDLNSNGTLDDVEVQNSAYICNGTNGTNTLVDIVTEAAGENCTNGGYKVISGVDSNGSGILEEGEIDDIEFICNGTEGVSSLVDVIQEPAGDNCLAGGYKIISGIDLNENGSVDENEIENSIYICNGSDGMFMPSSKVLVAIKEDGNIIYNFKYDSLNRLIQLNTAYYEYDSLNRLIQSKHNGYIDTYEYSNEGRIVKITTVYPATNKKWSTLYEYGSYHISKGVTYYNDVQTGYILYKYDSNGNTIERTAYSTSGDSNGYIISQYKITYDDKVLPIKNLAKYPFDMVQKNNPIYYYYNHAAMSTPPHEYNISYDYDRFECPIKEYQDTRTFEYEYREIEED